MASSAASRRPRQKTGVWAAVLALPVKLVLVLRLLKNWILLPREVREFRASTKRIEDDARGARLTRWSRTRSSICADVYARDLRPEYKVTVMNDFVTQQLYELLGRLIGGWKLGDPVATRNELLCGERGMDSVEPVRSIVRLAERVRREPALHALFTSSAQPAERVGTHHDRSCVRRVSCRRRDSHRALR